MSDSVLSNNLPVLLETRHCKGSKMSRGVAARENEVAYGMPRDHSADKHVTGDYATLKEKCYGEGDCNVGSVFPPGPSKEPH